MPWKTRKRGTKRQVGKHFFVDEKGDKRDLPRGMKVVDVPDWSELKRKFREPFEDEETEPEPIPSLPTEEEIIQAGIEEMLEKLSPEQIEELIEETEGVRPARRRKTTAEQEVDWTEIARRKKALKKHARAFSESMTR